MSFARQVFQGVGEITLASGATRLIALLTIPVLTPLLGPSPYGAMALVGTVTSLATALAMAGIDLAYLRHALGGDESQRAAVERFCWRFAASGAVIAALAVGFVGVWFGDRWLDDHRAVAAYAAVSIMISVVTAMMTTRARLQRRYRRISISLVVGPVVAAGLSIALALWWRRDLWALLLGVLGGSMVALLVLGLPPRDLLFRGSGLPARYRHSLVRLGIAGSITAPLYLLMVSADRWLLAHYGTTAEVGVYSVAASVAMMGLLLHSGLTIAWFPEATRAYGAEGTGALPMLARVWTQLVAGLAMAWLGVTAVGGDLIRMLAAPEFARGATYVPWLAGGVFFYGLASLANTGLLLSGTMRYSAIVWATGVAACIGLYFFAIPRFGAYGAAVTQCAGFGVIACGALAVSQRALPLPLSAIRLTGVIAVTLGAGVLLAPAWAAHPLASLALKLPVGAIAGAVLLQWVAPGWREGVIAFLKGIAPRQE